MNKKGILIIIVVLMTIGFAAVATNLMINGSVTIGNSIDDFDIRFTKSVLEGVENNDLIIDNGKKIEYSTSLSKTKGSSELVYDITNNSSLYDAKVSVICTANGTTVHPDLYTIDTTNTPEIIKSMNSASGSIRVSLIKDVTEEISESFECSLSLKSLTTTKKYSEERLNGTDPVISGDLIPITLSSTGKVTYADVKEEWYNYEKKNWANAVILTEDSKAYNVGEVISEDDIESYFVWIPKYKYRLWNVESTEENKGKHSIDIVFGTEDTTDIENESCVTPMISGESGNCNNGEYMTHPAFISMGTTGLWVGKFETGYKGAKTTSEAEQNNANPSNIIIKPNVYSWRNNTISNMFMASYNYNRGFDSHMMKNTEWGAVAYLSHSVYGINDEVRINNNSAYLTGYAANEKDAGESVNDNKAYNTETGYLASTTGNITGIYDMSGGAFEYVAGHISDNVGDSGLTIAEINNYNSKYFDTYDSLSADFTYQYRILGDATGEVGPFNNYIGNWYNDYALFVISSLPWFFRGGAKDGVNSGQFSYTRHPGSPYNYGGFRVVLAF